MKKNDWHLDRHIPVALIAALLVQTSTIVWWAAKIETRVEALEAHTAVSSLLIERVSRMEEKVTNLKESSQRIEDKIDALIIKRRRS